MIEETRTQLQDETKHRLLSTWEHFNDRGVMTPELSHVFWENERKTLKALKKAKRMADLWIAFERGMSRNNVTIDTVNAIFAFTTCDCHD